ncbi:MAG: sufS [Burkholderiaceae bacterium]|nr:sufS [Burkholderiaceae bacterium]
MTIQTPINNTANNPAGFPDVGELSRLASQFFATLPNGKTAGGFEPSEKTANSGFNTVESSGSPQNLILAGGSLPSLIPNAVAPNGVPDTVLQSATGFEPKFSNVLLGVPEAQGLEVSSLTETSGAPSTPYYFLGEASGAPVNTQAAPVQDEFNAQSFGLPSDDDLRSLLAQPSRNPSDGVSAQSAKKDNVAVPSAGYYFLESANLGNGIDGDVHAQSAQKEKYQNRGIPFDINAIRRDFPILQERVNGKQLVWFDNAATTHKPQSVIDRIAYFYAHENSNIHRAAHELAARATDAYESARNKVAKFIGASSPDEVIFVRGATEAINLVAKTWGVQNVGKDDEIIVSNLEHHANIVPWQQLAQQVGAKIRVIPVDDTGQVILSEYAKLLNPRTKIVAVTQVSNALGTVTPIQEIVALAHAAGAKALVDGAQSVSHMRVNVQAIDADFFVFSGHKVFAPTGIGVVYGKRTILENMNPWQGGGNMIADVTFEKTIFQPPPNRFEAGTGNIADAVGLGAAIDYVEHVGIENIAQYEHDLLEYATYYLKPIKGVRLIGTAAHKASVLSFVLAGYSTEEVGKALNEEGIAVRSGHHCAQPILRRFGVEATVRPSLAFYNTCEEVDRFIAVIHRLSAQRS